MARTYRGEQAILKEQGGIWGGMALSRMLISVWLTDCICDKMFALNKHLLNKKINQLTRIWEKQITLRKTGGRNYFNKYRTSLIRDKYVEI